MPTVHNDIFDDGLSELQTIATATDLDIHICSQEPTTYTEAITTYSLGSKADISVTGPADGDVSGRKIAVDAITGGTVGTTGTATHYALVDTTNSLLLVTQGLSVSASVTNGNTWSMVAFDIEKLDPV